jgi:hypothetical protein
MPCISSVILQNPFGSGYSNSLPLNKILSTLCAKVLTGFIKKINTIMNFKMYLLMVTTFLIHALSKFINEHFIK